MYYGFQFFSFFANSFMSFMYIRWLNFSCDQLNLYTAVHFLCMWFSGIMAIMNSRGDSTSPWKIPLWIFVSAQFIPPVVNSTLQFFMVFSMKLMTSCDILYISRQYYYYDYYYIFSFTFFFFFWQYFPESLPIT